VLVSIEHEAFIAHGAVVTHQQTGGALAPKGGQNRREHSCLRCCGGINANPNNKTLAIKGNVSEGRYSLPCPAPNTQS
jgi:hypothetical protein